MEDLYDQIDALLAQSREMPDGPARTAVVNQCVRLADLTQDQITQFQCRAIYIDSAFESGEADEMLVALSWCMGVYDKDPETFDSAFQVPNLIIDLMSRALGYITDFPSISRKKVEAMLDDFERRHQESGLGLRTVYLERTRNRFWMGDLESSKENYEKFMSCSQESGWGDVSERIFRTDFHVRVRDDVAAVAEAEPVIQSTGAADEVSHWIMSFVLDPLVRLNRLEDAKSCHERGYRVCRNNPKYLGVVARHLNYLVAVGDHAKAIAMLENHAPWVLEACSVEKAMRFYTAGWKLCRDLDEAGTSNIRIQLPDSIGPASDDGNYHCKELASWFEVEAKKIAALFNERNGNETISDNLQAMLDLRPPV